MDVCHAFLKKVRESGLVEPADRIVVGVSGGVDSAVLLDILSRLENEEAISIFIAHVNYGLRGKESDRDEKFVARLAKGYGCKFFDCLAKCHIPTAQFFLAIQHRQTVRTTLNRLRFQFLTSDWCILDNRCHY